MRRCFLLACAVLAAGSFHGGGVAAQDAPQKPTLGKAQPLKVERGIGVSPSTLVRMQRAMSVKQDEDGEAGGEEEGQATYSDGNRQYYVFNVEFDSAESCQAFALKGMKVLTRFDRWADIFVPQDIEINTVEDLFNLENDKNIQAVKKAKGFVWMDSGTIGVIPPPARPTPVKETPRSIPDKIVRGGLNGVTGKGAVVAVIDTGIDFRHPDFCTYDADGNPTSRLLYYWDTTSDAYASGIGEPAPYTYPNGAPIGTIYSREVLTEDIRGRKTRISTADVDGHGTACAGVAAGNGNSNKEYAGVAPGADIIGVRIASGRSQDIENAFMLNAICEWLDKVCGQKPLVVSCSFGGQHDGRDGQLAGERELSARFNPKNKGRAICVAAGNEGRLPIHASLPIGPEGDSGQIQWMSEGPAIVQVYMQTDHEDDLFLGPVGETELEEYKAFVHPLTGQIVFELFWPGGRGGLHVHSKSGETYVADAYISGYGGGAAFSEETVEFGKQLGSPSVAENILTIGSYDWNDQYHAMGSLHVIPDPFDEPIEIGRISTYSSQGPLRFGKVTKPELVAPGQWYAAAAPFNMNPLLPRESGGLHMLHNGTSAATPYAAGVIALLFEANPNLTWGDVRSILIGSVTQDVRTGECPNPNWGNGKLDYAAVEKAVAKAKEKAPATPKPASKGKAKAKAKTM